MNDKISGARIKELRIQKGMSADDLGKLIGKNRATVYRYEDGSIDTIPIGTVKRLAEIFEVSPAYLIGYSDDPNQTKFKRIFEETVEKMSSVAVDGMEPLIEELVSKFMLLPDEEKKKAIEFLSFYVNQSQKDNTQPSP